VNLSKAGDKFQVQEGQPLLLPHSCVGCHTNKYTDYIDLGMSLPKYGRFYLCIECFGEIAISIGYSNPVSTEELLLENASKSNQLRTLKEENARIRNLVSISIPGLRNDLVDLQFKQPEVVPTPRRSPGRPKSTEQGTP